jgi:class 3 adenylate cyclase
VELRAALTYDAVHYRSYRLQLITGDRWAAARRRVEPRVHSSSISVKRARPPNAKTVSVTVLFADLRGYTRLAEKLPPARVVPLLEEFFGILSKATEMHGGRVFHVAGDGMMAGFGVEDPDHDGASDALGAGYAMLNGFSTIAARWRRELSIETGVGIGLHQGDVALALFGPPRHRTATLVGDTVNVAARLCSRARAGEVLFSCTVAASLDAHPSAEAPLRGQVPFLQLPQFELRGRSELLDIWCVPALERLAV